MEASFFDESLLARDFYDDESLLARDFYYNDESLLARDFYYESAPHSYRELAPKATADDNEDGDEDEDDDDDTFVHTFVPRAGSGTAMDPVILKEMELAFIDIQGVDSKVYCQQGEKKLKSDKKLRNAAAIQTTNLDGCFAFVIVDEAKGGLIAHLPPDYCRWLDNPSSVDKKVAAAAKQVEDKIEKMIKSEKKDLTNGQVVIVNGPETPAEFDEKHKQHMLALVQKMGVVDQTIREHKIPKTGDGGPGDYNPVTQAKKVIKLGPGPNGKLTLFMGPDAIAIS